MTNLVKEIDKKINLFFELINRGVVKYYYLNDLENWYSLCASLHLLKDIQKPKIEYYQIKSINHLNLVGIMQTIYIEQDCVKLLFKSFLELKKNKQFDDYIEIRNIRNKVFGHPTLTNHNKIKEHHFFYIEDVEKQIFTHTNWSLKENDSIKEYSVKEIVLKNTEVTLNYLNELQESVYQKLKIMKKNFKINFKEMFKGSEYLFGKLLTKEIDNFILSGLNTFKVDLKKTKFGLKERNLYGEYFKIEFEIMECFYKKLNEEIDNDKNFKDIEFYSYASVISEKLRDYKKELVKIDSIN